MPFGWGHVSSSENSQHLAKPLPDDTHGSTEHAEYCRNFSFNDLTCVALQGGDMRAERGDAEGTETWHSQKTYFQQAGASRCGHWNSRALMSAPGLSTLMTTALMLGST